MYFDYAEYVRCSPEYAQMLCTMEEEITYFLEHYHDDSRFISGWGHGYFCEEDGGRLEYMLEQPFEHRCSVCGRVYRDYRYNACFITMMRNEAIVTAVKAGILYQVRKDKKYADIVKGIVSFYRNHYHEFPIHAKDKIWCSPTEDVGGAGKIMPQGLNEAIIGIRMINALELIKDALEPDWLLETKEKLFAPMVALLIPQKQHIHNIPVWINSAIGVMGFFFQEEAWMKEATVQPFNLFEQLKCGVTDSGFWYEGSIHYNFFALEGIMNFFTFAKAYGYCIPETYEKTVFHMLDAAYQYAFDNDVFPNPSDGWPNIGLKTYSYIYDMGYKALGVPVLPYIKAIKSNLRERTRLPLSEPYYYENRISLEQLLFAPEVCVEEKKNLNPRGSRNFEAYNCATLRNQWFNVFFKYGHQTRSHAHPDKMNVELTIKGEVLSKDLSNSGYVSRLCNEWHRTIAAHNTCAVNGQMTDMELSGTCIAYTDTSIKAVCCPYVGTEYSREITLNGNKLKDVFVVDTKENSTIDWFFHVEDEWNRDKLSLLPVELFDEYGKGLISQVHEITDWSGEIKLSHPLAELTLMPEPGTHVYLAKTYNNPADKMRDTIIMRTYGSSARFYMEIKAR